LTEVLARNPAEIVSKFTVQTIKTIWKFKVMYLEFKKNWVKY
jgi:hypothetical protein